MDFNFVCFVRKLFASHVLTPINLGSTFTIYFNLIGLTFLKLMEKPEKIFIHTNEQITVVVIDSFLIFFAVSRGLVLENNSNLILHFVFSFYVTHYKYLILPWANFIPRSVVRTLQYDFFEAAF